jgi:hypothetical protein
MASVPAGLLDSCDYARLGLFQDLYFSFLAAMVAATPAPAQSIVIWPCNGHPDCVVPPPNRDFVAVAVGNYHHSLALRPDGSILAFGSDPVRAHPARRDHGGHVLDVPRPERSGNRRLGGRRVRRVRPLNRATPVSS